MPKEERLKAWPVNDAAVYWDKIVSAVRETQSMVITYGGQLAKHVKYHSTSNGKTENSLYVFGYQEPYLTSVESPNEEDTPKFKSTVVKSNREFVRIMKELDKGLTLTEKNLASQVKITEWTEGGRVKTIKVGNKTFSGVDIRWAMMLNSASFSIKIDSKNVSFDVRGNGHGVGMSQYGANAMAKERKNYEDIIKHYYSGTVLSKLEDVIK